ncbi:MAG: hypothetical protein AB1898_28570 [Acidobacteriota bacterium]
MRLLTLSILLLELTTAEAGQRVTVPLDGTWQIEDSVAADEIPNVWRHKVPVPGLANLAQPTFADVDLFDSRELIDNQIRAKTRPESARISEVGKPRQKRNYFWYRRAFGPPARNQVAILKISKAQFGTSVWLNGRQVGEHFGCFTAGYFNVTGAMNWENDNDLIVRVGAHPKVLPLSVPTGTDLEKLKWTPGIYDRVALLLSDNPVIETVQIAPAIDPTSITVHTVLRNYGKAVITELAHTITEWRSGTAQESKTTRNVVLESEETKVITDYIKMPDARLWSPEDPFLYVLKTATGGDSIETRFGIREFRFDTPTKRAYLNGKPYFLRGSNISLHRFFEDPLCRHQPWEEAWVRKLLIDVPKRMHWNTLRFAIGPVPEFWFDITDEAGLLIQNEYFIWTGEPREIRSDRWNEWTIEQLLTDFKEYLRDHWNHPSQAIWDASNETHSDVLRDRIIPEVRTLDLSNRPWDNGYNLPSGPHDPVEDHPYLFFRVYNGGEFNMTELETTTGAKSPYLPHPTAHPVIINEYGWLWLNRDGSPTQLTTKIYDKLLGPNATSDQRFELNAYLLAGLTEYWRAHRNAAGVLHFVYLTSSYKSGYTSDHFRDVEKLELQPAFEEWVGEAFKPLGVYINFWQDTLKRGTHRDVAVMMVNDYANDVAGNLSLAFVGEDGEEASRVERPFAIPALGAHTYAFVLQVPRHAGRYILNATATAADELARPKPTISRRKVRIQ